MTLTFMKGDQYTSRRAAVQRCQFPTGLRRLPKLDAIASGVRDPGEATVLVIFAVRINLHPLRLECLEQSVELEALYVSIHSFP